MKTLNIILTIIVICLVLEFLMSSEEEHNVVIVDKIPSNQIVVFNDNSDYHRIRVEYPEYYDLNVGDSVIATYRISWVFNIKQAWEIRK